jgi:hypothetical protein
VHVRVVVDGLTQLVQLVVCLEHQDEAVQRVEQKAYATLAELPLHLAVEIRRLHQRRDALVDDRAELVRHLVGNSLCHASKHFGDIRHCTVDLGCRLHRQQLVEMFAAQEQGEGWSEQARSARTARARGRCGREAGREAGRGEDWLAKSRSCREDGYAHERPDEARLGRKVDRGLAGELEGQLDGLRQRRDVRKVFDLRRASMRRASNVSLGLRDALAHCCGVH